PQQAAGNHHIEVIYLTVLRDFLKMKFKKKKTNRVISRYYTIPDLAQGLLQIKCGCDVKFRISNNR
ncbi:MAG: hypothetical protein WC690_09460, partial [bacterium]